MTPVLRCAACACVFAIAAPVHATQRGAGTRAHSPEAGIARIASFIVRNHALLAEAR